MKAYLGLGFILLLGIAFWYHGNQREEAGVNSERARWQSKYLAVQQERDKYRSESEKTIIADRKKIRGLIDIINKTPVPVECAFPDDILRVLYDSGIYTGETSAVRPADIQ